MALRPAIGVTVQTLLAVGQASANPVLHMWVAHALWLIANAAGLSYVPHVQVTVESCYPRNALAAALASRVGRAGGC